MLTIAGVVGQLIFPLVAVQVAADNLLSRAVTVTSRLTPVATQVMYGITQLTELEWGGQLDEYDS